MRIWTHGMITGTVKAVEVETTVVVAADKTTVVADKTTVAAVITTVAAVVDKTTVAVATTNMKATGRSFDRLFAFYY